MQSARVGKRGAIVVPAKLRKRFGIEEGSSVLAEETKDGILIRPGDVQHFGPYFDKKIEGIEVALPGKYLRLHALRA